MPVSGGITYEDRRRKKSEITFRNIQDNIQNKTRSAGRGLKRHLQGLHGIIVLMQSFFAYNFTEVTLYYGR